MKLLIFNNPPPDRIDLDKKRFSFMASTLREVGLIAEYQIVSSILDLEKLLDHHKPDLVYSADYFLPDDNLEQQSIHEFLEERKTPFIGSDAVALSRVLSKSETKETWKFYDISTPGFCHILTTLGAERILDGFLQTSKFPYILKPDMEGNSRGLDESSIVFDRTGILEKTNELLKIYEIILVEEYLGDRPDLREFTVAMIGNQGHRLLMPAEITPKEQKLHRLITTEDKDRHRTLASPVQDAGLRDKLCRFAEKAFSKMGMVDYSRCDILMADGKLYALEINGLPMIPDKWFEVCAAGAGLDSGQYLLAIFAAGMIRYMNTANLHFKLTPEILNALPKKVWHTLCEGEPCSRKPIAENHVSHAAREVK